MKFHDGTVVPALGQGSARLGQGRHPEPVEDEALREGISLGMTLIDTAEIYGNSNAEKLIGYVIAGRRTGDLTRGAVQRHFRMMLFRKGTGRHAMWRVGQAILPTG